MRSSPGSRFVLAAAPIVLLLGSACDELPPPVVAGDLVPLSTVPVPQPAGSDIINQNAAIRLGKTLFWDVQVSSDGQVACATCHFRGGADDRRVNAIHPGPDNTFASGGVTGPGQTFNGAVILNDDRVASAGVAGGTFVGLSPDPSTPADDCTAASSPPFLTFRRVAPRNTPSVIGAVFYLDTLWDGRAHRIFNGTDVFGSTGNGTGALIFDRSSLASQALGPLINTTLMSCAGRTINGPSGVGAKLLARRPLQWQAVSRDDSVLGSLVPASGLGLNVTYQALIDAAFAPAVASQAQDQFSRIFGQAIQAYEATLNPNDTPLDRYLAGNRSALTARQVRGLELFVGKADCNGCHAGAEMSDATVSFIARRGPLNEDGGDQGYHNIGVRPTDEDLGRGGSGPLGVSFSVSGSAKDRGAFKTPSLRNVGLTAPYFHNGGQATLADVVEFYNHGGDAGNPELASDIRPLGLTADESEALVDFLGVALTDCRVQRDRAPFDHPALDIPDGPSLPAVGAAGLGSCP